MKAILTTLIALSICSAVYAGAWGVGSFENDDAMDWVAECTAAAGKSFVRATIDAALSGKSLDVTEASSVVAASEVVAAALGHPSKEMPVELSRWIKAQSSSELASLAPSAQRALQRVKNPQVSELRQLWAEGDEQEWLAKIKELEVRLHK